MNKNIKELAEKILNDLYSLEDKTEYKYKQISQAIAKIQELLRLKNEHKGQVNTDNKDWLTIIEPFDLLRGRDNIGKKMGQAKDEQGVVYDIYPAPCNINTCFCWATAQKIKN